MPKIPLAVVSTSSDDSDGSDGDLATNFRGTNWTVLNMASIESFPFSEVSHQPYGMESTFLDSTPHGPSNLRLRGSASGAQDMASNVLKASPRSPRPLYTQDLHSRSYLQTLFNATHSRDSNSLNSTITSAVAVAAKKNGVVSPATPPAKVPPAMWAVKHTTDLSTNSAVPGPPPMSRRARKVKPVSRRTRLLQVGVPQWRDNDSDMELLVRREVSKNLPASPAVTEKSAVLSLSSSSDSEGLTPPPPWVESSPVHNGGTDKAEALKSAEATKLAAAKAPAAEAAKVGTDAADGALGSVKLKDKKPPLLTTATRLPLQKSSVSSLGEASAAPPPFAHTQPQCVSAASANSDAHRTSSPSKPSPTQPDAIQHSAVPATSTAAAQNNVAFSPLREAGRVALSATRRIVPIAKEQQDKLSKASTAASSAMPVQTRSNNRGEIVVRSSPDANGDEVSSRGLPSRRVEPKRSIDLPGSSHAKAIGDSSGAAVLPPVSPSSAGVVRGSVPTSATHAPAPNVAASVDSPHSAKREQWRRNGHQQLSPTQSKDTDEHETVSGLVETVVVHPQVRYPAHKPLITSPIESTALPFPSIEGRRSLDNVRNSFPALSPQQLASATAEMPLHAGRRAENVVPFVDVSPAQHSDVSDALHTTDSMHTASTLVTDSPPTLRPQTRAFTEKADLAPSSSSFVSPSSRAAAERLVTFVRAVSDPEVLHVIHDYLVEHKRTNPRYRLAATACEELLERKEELLKTQEPQLAKADDTSRRGVCDHATEAESFMLDVTQTEDAKEATNRAAELQRLLAEIAAEQQDQGHDPDADEFDDFNFFDTPYPTQGHFSFGQPTVSGVVSRVFAEGMLFKIKTVNGEYYFYNDTLHDVMMVRVQCVLRGTEVINERAMLAPVEGSRETEVTIAVLPEETNFFMSGVSHLPHFMAKRVAVPPDYVSPSVTQSLRKINAEINSVRKALGKWSRASDQDAFLKCCLKNHLRFTDLTFRPCAESLSRRDWDAVAIPPVTWRRPEEYVYLPEVSQVRLFRGEISCFLVKQGELSNHTVVAAMAAVAQFPQHVRWMFRHPVSADVGKMERAEGCYRVTLLHNGWWKTYVIDDYVPASQTGPLFASCAEDPRRLWVPLLEKAYAKCLGSYAATCVVDAMEAMGDFTGFPARYLDAQWAAAQSKPTEAPSRTLFSYVNRVVRAGCTVLLFTPAASDAQSKKTVDFSRKRFSRLLPVKGVMPQFLPGHIYFLHDVAFYEELDLRMAQLKNPWTWETKNKMYCEKKWKYTTWYDRPDVSMSAIGSALGSSGTLISVSSSERRAAGAKAGMTKEESLKNDRKGTMWVEWGEVLAAFAGGGVCYTLWNYHRYRTRNSFVNGRPRFVLEVRTRRKIELFVTLSLETVSETLDSYGTVVASHPTPLHGTAMSVVRRVSKQSARVVSESCEDVESIAARRTYVVAKDVSMKLSIDPRVADGTVLVVPLLNPQAVEEMAAAASAKTGGGSSDGSASAASQAQTEVRFVLSVVSDAVAGDGEDLTISFVSMRRSCGVFTDSTAPFDLESTSRVTSLYQICTERGVTTLEGNRICDAVSGQQPS
ncbi:putative calpain-like protein [Leptomonas pyrrhocoris]|uniref:Putative calpain-like protein n=1 Tax=Leptomonas pyrrhocoris TaxID=157538 RepID=A0A0M9FQI3_LEPPY|nr:putative calpain-like protein [Leptomonas pyrrhocoris]KPA73947.1 putative calpain-like protein [Leptomonas pyrrhocoris]|eukprot:XP_015652386.1 putative calpain-like protein [Leptomonas pyrrhocoris]